MTKGQNMNCKNCGHAIRQGHEKAVGSGEWETAWVDNRGAWVCPVTGDEHEPGEQRRPVQVIVKHGTSETMIRLTLAEYGNFIVDPILGALDDGDASWDLQDLNRDRHASLDRWAKGLYGVTE